MKPYNDHKQSSGLAKPFHGHIGKHGGFYLESLLLLKAVGLLDLSLQTRLYSAYLR